MKRITIWERKTGHGWAHNHIEDGWATSRAPKPMCTYQQHCWMGAEWRCTHALLEGDTVRIGSLRDMERAEEKSQEQRGASDRD